MASLKRDPAYKYPNEIGRVHVSLSHMQMVPVEAADHKMSLESMAKDIKKDGKHSKKSKTGESSMQNADEKAIDDIWKHLGLGHIDISYACVGYSMDGRPVLSYDDFMNLLVTYGFKVQDVLKFIEDFASHSTSDEKSPIVMFTTNSSAIMTNIEPIA